MPDITQWSVDHIERAHTDGIITADDAIAALLAKRKRIEESPANRNPKGALYIFTPTARRRLDALAWAITRTMAARKRETPCTQ